MYTRIYIFIDGALDHLRVAGRQVLPGGRARRAPTPEVALISFFFLTQRVFFQQEFRQFLLRRWTGIPPETLSGLTSNPLRCTRKSH